MSLRFHFLFVFYTLLFLFYPGNSYYFRIFAYNRNLFSQQEKKLNIKLNPVPYLKLPYYPEISAQGVYVVDYPSFTPIMERHSRKSFFPASTTKIITALVAYDVYQPNQIITINKVISDGQIMGLVLGEKITVENLLYGVLVHSANDAAYALAENFGYQNFIDLMNKKAKELKMINSHFVNPAGYDDIKQTTSPFDLALASRTLLSNEYLTKIVATKEITISDIDFKIFHRLSNVNKLLGEIPGVGGVKTGYTENAGENLVSFYKKNGHQLIIVILKSQDRFTDTKKVIFWAEENLAYLNP